MLTGMICFYSLSTVSFSATDGPICGPDSHDKSYWNADDLMIYYFCKGEINFRVIGLVT